MSLLSLVETYTGADLLGSVTSGLCASSSSSWASSSWWSDSESGSAKNQHSQSHPEHQASTSFYLDCRLYKGAPNTVDWQHRLSAQFFTPDQNNLMLPKSMWKENLQKNPVLLQTERYQHDPETQCHHFMDLFMRKELDYDSIMNFWHNIPGVSMLAMAKSKFMSLLTGSKYRAPPLKRRRLDGRRGSIWAYSTEAKTW